MIEFTELHNTYSDLFKGYAIMPKEDIMKNVTDLGLKYKHVSWAAFGLHLQRMRSTLEASNLNEVRRSWVINSLNPQIREYTFYHAIPEKRPYLIEGDRAELKRRRLILENGHSFNNEEDLWREEEAKGKVANWRDIPKSIIKDIDLRLKMLDDQLARLSSSAAHSAQTLAASGEQYVVPSVQADEASAELNSLFRHKFTVQHCDELMKKVLVGPNYKSTTHLSAKIWALLFVLEEHGLLSCSPAEAAEIAGRHYGRRMAKKPSKTIYNRVTNALFSIA